MAFSVSDGGKKRLARRVSVTPANNKAVKRNDPPKKKVVTGGTNLFITPYTERSFVVMGDTIDHSNALVALGGKYNTGLRIGQGWIFAKVREESVQKYIDTGEIEPYVYSKEDQNKFEQRNGGSGGGGIGEKQLRTIFRELREAFDTNEDYEGTSIIDVIYQLEERHLPRKEEPKSSPKQAPKRLARKQPPQDDDDDEEEAAMESESESEEEDDEE